MVPFLKTGGEGLIAVLSLGEEDVVGRVFSSSDVKGTKPVFMSGDISNRQGVKSANTSAVFEHPIDILCL